MKNDLYKQPVVFIVDDDEDDLYFIKSAILSNIPNCIVKCFIHGKQLLDSLSDWKDDLPSFILLDLNMPFLNGKETLKILRNNSETAPIPVVIFSTSNNPSDKALCKKFGANDYFCKPASINIYDELIQKLRMEYIDRVEIV